MWMWTGWWWCSRNREGWATHLERDLGVSKARVQEAFFAPHFEEVVTGRAALRDRLAPVLAQSRRGDLR